MIFGKNHKMNKTCKDGAGIITFGADNHLFSWISNASWPGLGDNSTSNFELESDVMNIYNIIQKAQRDLEK